MHFKEKDFILAGKKRTKRFVMSEKQEKILIECWDKGNPIIECCENMGIRYHTFLAWRKKQSIQDMDELVQSFKEKNNSKAKTSDTIVPNKERLINHPDELRTGIDVIDSIGISVEDSKKEAVSEAANSLENNGKDSLGRFQKGHTYSKGIKNPYKKILSEVSEQTFASVNEVLIALCLKGDVRAIHLLYMYLMPSVEERGVTLLKKSFSSIAALSEAMDEVLEAAFDDKIDSAKANDLMGALEKKRSLIYSEQVEKGLAETNERARLLKETITKQNANEKLKGK